MKFPESMDECFYFTRRTLDNNGKIVAWVFKPDCPKCGKAKMCKPIDSKTGEVKIRAKEYVCSACKYTVLKDELEPTLDINIQYMCPHCGNSGEATAPYKKKKFQGVDAYIFECQGCHKTIPLTKKMKELKEE